MVQMLCVTFADIRAARGSIEICDHKIKGRFDIELTIKCKFLHPLQYIFI